MGNCWAKKACDYAIAQIGNECGKTNQYSAEMDAISFYNYPKNGVANSCSIFVDNCVLHGCEYPSYDEDPEGAKWTALWMLNEPQSAGANEGAGCAQSVRYFQEMGEWHTEAKDFVCGDKYFLRRNSAVSSSNPLGVYHTGIIVDWGYFDELGCDGFRCIEGNTNGGYVAEKFYPYSDVGKRIAGAGHPRYDGYEPENEPSKPEKPETPEMPTSDLPKEYTVLVNTRLRVRSGPSTDYDIIGMLDNGYVVTVYEIRDGWGRVDECKEQWCSMEYLI